MFIYVNYYYQFINLVKFIYFICEALELCHSSNDANIFDINVLRHMKNNTINKTFKLQGESDLTYHYLT